MKNFYYYSGLTLIAISLSSCSTITDSIAASTQTFTKSTTNGTESSTRVSSSNDSGSATATQVEQAVAFAKINWMKLSSNMAQGYGEHLMAMADIMNIREPQKPLFYQMTKHKFKQLFPSTETTAEQLIMHLTIEVAKLKKV